MSVKRCRNFLRMIASWAALVLLLLVSLPTGAQSWPDRPVRLIVPYAAGGNIDATARIVAHRLQQSLGQPFVVENIAGAGGLIAGETTAKAPPDGNTLFFGANGVLLFAPELAEKQPYQWRRDFAPVSMISFTPTVMQVRNGLPARTVAEFFDLVRKNPGKLVMSSQGIGGSTHLLSELMQARLGASWVTVQFRGSGPANTELMAERIDFNFDPITSALPIITGGKSRAIAMAAAKRSSKLPDIPTFAELGYPDFDARTFVVLLAPAGTPEPILEKLRTAIQPILQDREVMDKLDAMGGEAAGVMSPDEVRAYLEKESNTWLPIAKKIAASQQK